MRHAFDHVVTEHGAAVLRVCRALVGIDDADDVWAEAFVSAMRAYPELPPEANVEAWLVTIARRKGIDHLRARARRALPVEFVPERAAAAGLGAADRLDLYAALATLPTRQRECVAFHHLGGLPYAEVAAVLGGTEAAARRAAADGVRALRAVLAEAVPAGERATRPHGPGRPEAAGRSTSVRGETSPKVTSPKAVSGTRTGSTTTMSTTTSITTTNGEGLHGRR